MFAEDRQRTSINRPLYLLFSVFAVKVQGDFDPLPFHKLRLLYGYHSLTSIGKTKKLCKRKRFIKLHKQTGAREGVGKKKQKSIWILQLRIFSS